MGPSGLAREHSSYDTLLKYATGGCPVETGRPWTTAEITVAVEQGLHESALSDNAIEHFRVEAATKVASGQAKMSIGT